MNDKFKQQKAFALIVVLFLFFIWSQNTLSPFADRLSKDVASGPKKEVQSADLNGGALLSSEGAESVGASSNAQNSSLINNTEAPSSGVLNPENALPNGSINQGELQEPALAAKSPQSLTQKIESAGYKTVSNDKYTAKISLLGGRLVSLTLKEFRNEVDSGSGAYETISLGRNSSGELGVYVGSQNDTEVLYNLNEAKGFSEGAESSEYSVNKAASLTLQGQLQNGQNIIKVFKFEPESYRIGLDVAASKEANSSSSLEIEISKMVSEENSLVYSDTSSGATWSLGEEVDRESFSNLKKRGLQPLVISDLDWVSLSEKYFTQVIISEGASGQITKASGVFSNRSDDFIARLSQPSVAGAAPTGSFSYWSLPKDYALLKNIGFGLEKSVDFGLIGFLSEPLLRLLHWFNDVLGNFGLAIVALTILVRLLLYPLNAVQYKSMKAMQKLQPEMKRIRENIKDKQQQQMQLMSLYQKEGVNPFGGCFPMILQFPIVVGLYYGLLVDFGLRHAPFAFWIKDLSVKEALNIGGIGLPIMAMLMVVSMMYQTWTTPSAAEPSQKRIMMIMPLFLGFFFATFPAGLTLYWLTSTLIGIGQQRGMASDSGSKFSALKITLLVSAAVFSAALIFVKLGDFMA